MFPYRRFIRFVATRCHNYPDFRLRFDAKGLPCPTEEVYKSVKDNLLVTARFKPIRDYLSCTASLKPSQTFRTWLESEGVWELWTLEPEFRDVKDIRKKTYDDVELIANHLKIRRLVTAFLIKGCATDEIVTFIQKEYRHRIEEESVSLYSKYYFDLSSMSKSDWTRFLNSLDQQTKRLYLIAMNEDRNKLNFELGFKADLNYVDILNDILATSYYRFKNCVSGSAVNTIDAERNARYWAKTIFDAGDRKEKFRGNDTSTFSDEVQMQFKFDSIEFPNYSELNGGTTSNRDS